MLSAEGDGRDFAAESTTTPLLDFNLIIRKYRAQGVVMSYDLLIKKTSKTCVPFVQYC